MSLERTDKRRHRRRLSEDEHRLWSGVTRSIAPLKRKPASSHHPEAIAVPGKPALPVVGLDRRQKQRLARGTETIDGRIDLHGKTQSEAHAALLGFLRCTQADGARYVLVITGKGRPSAPGSSGEHGILKRQVPMWLRLPEFRLHVLAVEDAHAAHGGEGALYVRMRRARAQ